MFFRRKKNKKAVLTEKEIKWNLLWKKYAEGTLDKKHFILCDYHGGINGGGHYCFFDNKSDDLLEYVETLKLLLPYEFYRIFYKAYEAYVNDQDVENMCDLADDYFYKNEQVVIDILQEYADGLDDSSNGGN